jgi:GNAT superfamily N-acetyltransferase
MRIEQFQDYQAEAVSNLIRRNLLEVNSKDYTEDFINSLVAYFSPATLLENSRSQTIFVATQDGEVVGTASLDNFGSAQSPDYYAVEVFVLPELHRQGIGLRLMEAVELKAKELGAEKVTLRASITAKAFYQKLGYRFRDGCEKLDEHGTYIMEKEVGDKDCG